VSEAEYTVSGQIEGIDTGEMPVESVQTFDQEHRTDNGIAGGLLTHKILHGIARGDQMQALTGPLALPAQFARKVESALIRIEPGTPGPR
jgi:hypothetical protein